MQSKQKIEISYKLAELLTALTKNTLDSSESNIMFSDMFECMCTLLEKYDSDTIEEVHNKLFCIDDLIDLLNDKY